MKQIKINSSNVLIGMLIITAGILLLLFKAEVLPSACKPVIFSWPMILICIGLVSLCSRDNRDFGLLLMLIGGFFLLPKLNIEGFSFINENRWAIILIIIGVIIVYKALFEKKQYFYWKLQSNKDYQHNYSKFKSNSNEPGYLYREYVFGGSKESVTTKNFKGGKISCVFGGIELDLSEAELAEGVSHLELHTVFGGIIICVPVDWNIEIQHHDVLGHVEDKRPKRSVEMNKDKILIIHTHVVLGGGEIKCK
ncbi:MAG: cell wall-active antibiotics response protein [Bacteroidales bacterium]|nr:cell wall-active antibiotics response protein [Bacteroidales bacterium]MCL2132777.1 cell wall-active antibiotics response protein [Bacteroidales bacterium]